jgi:RecG-like helicase
LEIKAATEMFQQLKQTVFTDLAMGLLHGQMPAD